MWKAGTWKIGQNIELSLVRRYNCRKMEAVEIRMLRWMRRFTQKYRIRNIDIYKGSWSMLIW